MIRCFFFASEKNTSAKLKKNPESFHDMKRKQKDLEHQTNLIFVVGSSRKTYSTRLTKLPNQQEDQGNEKPQSKRPLDDWFGKNRPVSSPLGYVLHALKKTRTTLHTTTTVNPTGVICTSCPSNTDSIVMMKM